MTASIRGCRNVMWDVEGGSIFGSHFWVGSTEKWDKNVSDV